MKTLLRYIASRRVAAFLLVAWLMLVLFWVVPFDLYGLPESQVRSIVYGEPFFRAVYTLVAFNTAACIIAHTGIAFARARSVPSVSERLVGARQGRVALSSPARPEDVGRALAAEGFRGVRTGDGWIWAVKNRWSPIGTVLFHTGLILLLCGVSVGILAPGTRFQGDLVLAEGESFDGERGAYIDLPDDASKTPPQLHFTVERVQPRFYRDLLLFTSLEATVRSGGVRHAVSVSRPWLPSLSASVSLTDFGYALDVVARGDRAKEVQRAVYKLKAFPSGQRDVIEIAVGADRYRIYVEVYGDYVDRGGKPATESFNTDDPRLLVSVARALGAGGERMLAKDRLLRIGDRLEVPGLTLGFPRLRHYGVFRVVRDPAAPLVASALALALLGVTWRLVFPRTEASYVEEGSLPSIAVRSDFYGLRPELARRIARRLEGV